MLVQHMFLFDPQQSFHLRAPFLETWVYQYFGGLSASLPFIRCSTSFNTVFLKERLYKKCTAEIIQWYISTVQCKTLFIYERNNHFSQSYSFQRHRFTKCYFMFPLHVAVDLKCFLKIIIFNNQQRTKMVQWYINTA